MLQATDKRLSLSGCLALSICMFVNTSSVRHFVFSNETYNKSPGQKRAETLVSESG